MNMGEGRRAEEGQKRKKKGKSVLICLALVFALAFALFALPRLVAYGLFFYASETRLYAEIDECETEFQLVAQYAQEHFADGNSYWVEWDRELQTRKLSETESGEITLPDDVREALCVICEKGFVCKDSKLGWIDVTGDEIRFVSNKGYYALVYSPKGKPASFDELNPNRRLKIRKAAKGWYHVLDK